MTHPKEMTVEEQREWITAYLRKKVENMADQGDASKIVEGQVVRILDDLQEIGRITSGAVQRVEGWDSLSPATQVRLLQKYIAVQQWTGADVSLFHEHLDAEEYKWLIAEQWRATEAVEAQLRKEATYGGTVDWEKYNDLLRAHPHAFQVGIVERPEGKMFVEMSVTPVMPLNYIRHTFVIGEAPDAVTREGQVLDVQLGEPEEDASDYITCDDCCAWASTKSPHGHLASCSRARFCTCNHSLDWHAWTNRLVPISGVRTLACTIKDCACTKFDETEGQPVSST